MPSDANLDKGFPLVIARASDFGTRAKLTPNPRVAQLKRTAADQKVSLDATFRATVQPPARGSEAPLSVRPDPDLDAVLVLRLRSSVEDLRTSLARFSSLELLDDFSERRAAVDDVEEGEPDDGGEPGGLHTVYALGPDLPSRKVLLDLWDAWLAADGGSLPIGFGPWRDVFALLEDIHVWGVDDRIEQNALSNSWGPQLEAGASSVLAEVELWFRTSADRRRKSEAQVREVLEPAGARVIDVSVIPEVAYHALLVEVPRDAALQILSLEGAVAELVPVSRIRPQSEAVTTDTSSAALPDAALEVDASRQPEDTLSLVVLLDGKPNDNHRLLAGRTVLADPTAALAGEPPIQHGTGMASAVIYGDLVHGSGNALQGALTVEPIFMPLVDSDGKVAPGTPPERLPVALIHDALTRVWRKANPDRRPRVVVLAAGQVGVALDSRISPWARLLDYWASAHGVLFVISAGNKDIEEVSLPAGTDPAILDNPELLRDAFLAALSDVHPDNRVLPPGDAINALTVGSFHRDVVQTALNKHEIDPLADASFASPISRSGGGALGAVKPEVLVDAGRVLYRREPDLPGIVFRRVLTGTGRRGIHVAASTGRLDVVPLLGTSYAAGLVGHRAGRIMELLETQVDGHQLVHPDRLAVATKALIVNSASWSGADEFISNANGALTRTAVRQLATQALGYGRVDEQRIALGDRHRITVLVTGNIWSDSSRTVKVPIPASLAGRAEWRKASVTLAWMSPVNSRHQGYREARLWFTMSDLENHQLARNEADWRTVRRGTVQHEIIEGDRAVNIDASTSLDVVVHYAASAGASRGTVFYGLVVTFEVASDSSVPVYSEVAAALRAAQPVTVTPTVVEVRVD